MKEWTRKRKADVCMGILLQIYFFFPWIRIDGGYHTIHVYLIEIFRKESCIKAYNYIFLSGHPILWKYSGFAAVTFTMIIAFMIVMQMIELWQLYRHMKGIKTFDIHRYVWVLAIVLFFLYLDASYIYLDDSALFKLRIYMYMVIFIGIIGIWMFLDIEAAAWGTEIAKHKTELKERDEQLLQVKVKALEEKYQEMSFENNQEIMDLTMKTAYEMGMGPYYLYRQKNMKGNFENVGYAKVDKAGIYNILIMEEKQPIIALGAGGSSKLVFDHERRIERVENVKDVTNYISRIDEMIQRKQNGITRWLRDWREDS